MSRARLLSRVQPIGKYKAKHHHLAKSWGRSRWTDRAGAVDCQNTMSRARPAGSEGFCAAPVTNATERVTPIQFEDVAHVPFCQIRLYVVHRRGGARIRNHWCEFVNSMSGKSPYLLYTLAYWYPFSFPTKRGMRPHASFTTLMTNGNGRGIHTREPDDCNTSLY